MTTELPGDCCPGDPPGVMHSFDCPVYLANVEAWAEWNRRDTERRRLEDRNRDSAWAIVRRTGQQLTEEDPR